MAASVNSRRRQEADFRRHGLAGQSQLSVGVPEAALALLERAVAERDPNAMYLPVDLAFAALRAVPRFVALLRRVLGPSVTARALVQARGAAAA